MKAIRLLIPLLLLTACGQATTQEDSSVNDPGRRYFGLHFDFHASPERCGDCSIGETLKEEDIRQMIEDIDYCKSAGAAGIVVGALTPEGHIDISAMKRLVAAAKPLPVTFHRAYDVCTEDPFEALEQIITLGCTRLLTSGQAANAWEGRDLIRQLVDRAADRLIILAGRGVTPANLSALSAFTHAPEYHGTQLP